MTPAEAMEALTPIFRELFEDDKLVLKEETTAADVEGWDSVEHFSLIAEIEKKFHMRFQMREVSGMKNVGELARIVAERGKL